MIDIPITSIEMIFFITDYKLDMEEAKRFQSCMEFGMLWIILKISS